MLNITIKSKNKKLLIFFLLFLKENETENIKKQFKKRIKKQKLSILKSPHVNKKAQEQFEYCVFRKQFTIKNVAKFKYLIWLKKLSVKTFPNLSIKLKVKISNKNIKNVGLQVFNLKNFKLKKHYNFKIYNLKLRKLKEKNNINKQLKTKQINLLFKMFEMYGEFVK